MKFTIQEKNEQAIIEITGALTLDELETLREELIDCYDKHTGIVLDLKNVKTCDTAGIQLLWSTRKTAEFKNKSFSIINASDPVVNAAISIGITL